LAEQNVKIKEYKDKFLNDLYLQGLNIYKSLYNLIQINFCKVTYKVIIGTEGVLCAKTNIN